MTGSELIFPAYGDVVVESAASYRAYLVSHLAKFGTPLQTWLKELVELLDMVGDRTAPLLTLGGYRAADFKNADASERELLINQWALGWGRDDAPIIVMGTEEAYLPTGEDLGQWNCSCAAIWHSGGARELLERLDPRLAAAPFGADDFANRRPFHVYPNDYLMVHRSHWDQTKDRWVRPGRHTWKVISQVVAGPDLWRGMLDPTIGRMGDVVHQIELSAYPATIAAAGRPSSAERFAFLRWFVSRVRATARLLIFHGRPNQLEWGRRNEIASAFLDAPGLTGADWNDLLVSGSHVRYVEVDRRLVVLSRALNGAISSEHVEVLRRLVSKHVSVAPGSIGTSRPGGETGDH